MRPALLAGVVVVAALVMLGTATSTWLTVAVPTPSVEGAELPPQVEATSGATAAPTSVPAAVAGLAAAVPLFALGTATRLSGAAGRRTALVIATALAVGAAVLAVLALTGASADVVTPGGDTPPAVERTGALGGFGLAALVLVAAVGLAWRAPADRTRDPAPSAYTVEAVRGEVTEDEEWDLAVADDAVVADTADDETIEDGP